ARAQAQLEHDGNVGQVIEVTGSVRPLGVDVARIDAHGPVKARSAERPRPRWIVRTAVAGSVAAAAALALVVGNTLETRRNAEKVAAAHSSDFEIRVQPAVPPVVDSALRDAEAKQRQKDEIEPRGLGGVPVAAPGQEKTHDAVAQMPSLRKRGGPGARMQGSGGDAAESQAKAAANAKKERAVDTVAPAASDALECLSAAGQFDEARKVRDELVRSYPFETTAISAAARALRQVDVPAARPAASDPQR